MSKKVYHMGLDIGSTTIKIVITDEYDNMLYHQYRRHLSDMRNTLTVLIKEAYNEFPDALMQQVLAVYLSHSGLKLILYRKLSHLLNVLKLKFQKPM